MSTAFLDNIQIDEFDCIVSNEEMFDLFENNWESVIETDVVDWMMSND